jgi:autotransporter-associated beta strand protein
LMMAGNGGILILSGAGTYDGGTSVTAGTLVLASNTALLDGSSLAVGMGGVFIFDPSLAVAGQAAPAAHGPVPVPEPGTVVLLVIAACLAVISRWRRW